jgi:hypothetical protein
VLSKTTPLGEGPWDGGASCGHFFPVLTAIAVWRFRRFNLFLLFSLALDENRETYYIIYIY